MSTPRALMFAALWMGCGPTSEPAATVTVTPPASAPATSPPPHEVADERGASSDVPVDIGEQDPLKAGLVRFVGMVRPTKGGLHVRDVLFSFDKLQKSLANGGTTPTYDDLLGAKLQVVAELVERPAPKPRPEGAPAIQMRGGPGIDARRLVSAKLVAPAEMIEGKVRRSKGLFAVGKHMVTRDDLAWSLAGEKPDGQTVRLWGQPRTYVCPPQAQCLVEGSIPMFDVGRAELVK